MTRQKALFRPLLGWRCPLFGRIRIVLYYAVTLLARTIQKQWTPYQALFYSLMITIICRLIQYYDMQIIYFACIRLGELLHSGGNKKHGCLQSYSYGVMNGR